ncbi:hypothetical protein, partial [Roseomonas sp. TAS13]|uniref:hypothetical protein n=1 Tax=Roseomonas sp. TAS13 TaxID=1926319 RepID=UPI0011153BFF
MQRLAGTVWSDVTLRRTRGQADPDAPPRAVALPAAWEDGAADALAALMPGACLLITSTHSSTVRR